MSTAETSTTAPAAEMEDTTMLLRIIDILGVSTDQCCYVGDSIEDLRMAKAAGVRIVSMTSGVCSKAALHRAGAERLAGDLKELLRQVDACGHARRH